MLFIRAGGYSRLSVQRLSRAVSEEPREEEVKHGPTSVATAELKAPRRGKRKERQMHSETDRQARVGLCNQLNRTARQGKWSSMLNCGTVKHFSEEVKQVMY